MFLNVIGGKMPTYNWVKIKVTNIHSLELFVAKKHNRENEILKSWAPIRDIFFKFAVTIYLYILL